jgi:Protein of unknown function (DUF3048) N-terminal domain/Protein of unknown function (DUF3048) C-terminal domain
VTVPNTRVPPKPHTRSRLGRWASPITVAIAAAVLSGCGGHTRAATPPSSTLPTTPSTVATTTTTVPSPPTAPLTGLPQPDTRQLDDPAVVVKIDNVDAARPQSGINDADVVYEELVEGGLTRLAAVFQSDYPTVVGPVRSGRLTDEGIADDLNYPVFAYSGTNAVFLPILQSQPTTALNAENAPNEFYRTDYAAEPDNLYANVVDLAAASTHHTPPPPLFDFLPDGAAFSGAGIAPAVHISIDFPSAAITWDWDAGLHVWLRGQNGTPDVVRAGPQLRAANVIVQFIPYSTSLTASGEGVAPAPIPFGNMVGSGVAWFFSAAHVVKGTWSRSRLTAVTSYRDASGATIRFSRGQTWVELVPIGTVPTVVP